MNVNAKKKMQILNYKLELKGVPTKIFRVLSPHDEIDQIWTLVYKHRNWTKALELERVQHRDNSTSNLWMFNVDQIQNYTFHCPVLTQVEMMDSMRQTDALSQKCLNHRKLSYCVAPFHCKSYRQLNKLLVQVALLQHDSRQTNSHLPSNDQSYWQQCKSHGQQ